MTECPFCGNKSNGLDTKKFEYYPGFRHCKKCDKSFDYSDIPNSLIKSALAPQAAVE